METLPAIAVVGTFDSKAGEHLFLKEAIERRGLAALTIHVGTGGPSPFAADIDLFKEVLEPLKEAPSRDESIRAVLGRAQELVKDLFRDGRISAIVSAGGGTGTHIGTAIMRTLPLGAPKVMVSTVASRDMSSTVSTKDITMMHSVVDLLGVNSISGLILENAAAAVCGMVRAHWEPPPGKLRVALSLFGFITAAAEHTRGFLEEMGYEVIAFHANGTGGMALEELAAEGRFDGILDLATHELADELLQGYCRGIGPQRLEPVPGRKIPRLVVPGGLDCAVLIFTRDSIPREYRDRKVFFYDFRSAIRLDRSETVRIAGQLAAKANKDPSMVKMLVPMKGWSEADREGGPLYDPALRDEFMRELETRLDHQVEIEKAEAHINDPAFARLAAERMDDMIRRAKASRA